MIFIFFLYSSIGKWKDSVNLNPNPNNNKNKNNNKTNTCIDAKDVNLEKIQAVMMIMYQKTNNKHSNKQTTS